MLVESLMQLERNLELQRNFISDDDSDDEKPVIPEPTQQEPVVVAKRGRKRSKKQEEAVEQQKKKSKNDSTVDQPTTAAAPVLNSTFDAEKVNKGNCLFLGLVVMTLFVFQHSDGRDTQHHF